MRLFGVVFVCLPLGNFEGNLVELTYFVYCCSGGSGDEFDGRCGTPLIRPL